PAPEPEPELAESELEPTREELVEHVRKAIGDIDTTLSLLLEMFYWENIPANQLSELIGIPRNKVGSQLDAAKSAVRQKIELSGLTRATQRLILKDLTTLLRESGD
ncbi:MAG: hypothetical protein KC468_24625, partial [Myxococcales bacterium]|nr:hypothetical protein [Myxococcales bacterium]